MKRFQIITLMLLSFCFLAEINAAEEVSRCNVIPQITTQSGNQEIKFSVQMNNEVLNTFQNVDKAIQAACQLQENSECFYTTECLKNKINS